VSGAAYLFWIYAAIACGGAVAVVLSQNVVRMAVWLIFSLSGAAGLFFTLHADFVGATQLLVYVGGTLVLLIFGVMLTASGPYLRIRTSPAELFLSAGVGLLVLAMLFSTVLSVDWNRTSLQVAGLGERSKADFEAAVHREGVSAEDAKLIEEIYVVDEATGKFRLRPERRLTRDDAMRIASAFQHPKAIASFSPSDPANHVKGNTVRPLGFAFAGLRPDRDLGGSGSLSNGYLLPFEIVSVHLLVVLIGAAYLARAKRRRTPQSTP